jgi:hypothetical protein
VNQETYRNLLKDRDLKNKKVIDLGAGYSPPPKKSLQKNFFL